LLIAIIAILLFPCHKRRFVTYHSLLCNRKSVVVGAGYIAVELAGILQTLGSDVSLLIRYDKVGSSHVICAYFMCSQRVTCFLCISYR